MSLLQTSRSSYGYIYEVLVRRDPDGGLSSEGSIAHVYLFRNGLIVRIDLE
jgi:hypothetical protein